MKNVLKKVFSVITAVCMLLALPLSYLGEVSAADKVTYERITKMSQLESGAEYLIVEPNSESKFALKNLRNATTGKEEVSVSDNKISLTESAAEYLSWSFTEEDGEYKISNNAMNIFLTTKANNGYEKSSLGLAASNAADKNFGLDIEEKNQNFTISREYQSNWWSKLTAYLSYTPYSNAFYAVDNNAYCFSLYKKVESDPEVPDTPGESTGSADDIILEKTATDNRESVGNQTFDIDLSVQGLEITRGNKLDVVLVIDNSGSMDPALRAMTRSAANAFTEKVLKNNSDGNVRIAVVKYGTYSFAYDFSKSYNSYWTEYTKFNASSSYYSSNLTKIKSAISSATDQMSQEATNTEGAFLIAGELAEQGIKRADAEHITIFMTDGVPTQHYKNNGSMGGGNAPTMEDFNEAIDAAIALKQNSTIYNVGLVGKLTGDATIQAEKFLAQPPYKLSKDKSTVFSSTPSQAYAKTYYKISTTNSEDATQQMLSIYQDIASDTLSLATGTVTDIIPKDFELTADSKKALMDAGHRVIENADGTTTVIFEKVTAGKNKTNLPTFTIHYTGDGYGVGYTNTVANYAGKLYDGQTAFDKEFPVPVGSLHPKTVEDEDTAKINTPININVRENDPFEKQLVEGYNVSDYSIIITDQYGNPKTYTDAEHAFTVYVNADTKEVVFQSSTITDKEFYYVVQANVTQIGSNFAFDGQSVLKSAPTRVLVHVVDVEDKVFVVDFGKPITYAADQVFNSSELTAGSTISQNQGKTTQTYGTFTYNANAKSLTYALNKFMSGADICTFNEKLTKKQLEFEKTVTMLPANSVYYEDDFGDAGDGSTEGAVTYDANWEVVSTPNASKVDELKGDDPYGYDSNYGTEGILEFSDGSAHVVYGGAATATKASFEFVGTAVDIYSYTNNGTGEVYARVYEKGADGTYPVRPIFNQIFDTRYNSGTTYQVPTICFDSGNAQPKTYKVELTVPKNSTFYLDALRIYNPIGSTNENYSKEENGMQHISVRDQSISTDINGDAVEQLFNVSGNPFIDEYETEDGLHPAHTIDLSNAADYQEFVRYGRKTEVAIAPGKTVTLTLDSAKLRVENVQLGLRLDATLPVYMELPAGLGGDILVNGDGMGVQSATDMYYNVKVNRNNQLQITNETSSIITITKLKASYFIQ